MDAPTKANAFFYSIKNMDVVEKYNDEGLNNAVSLLMKKYKPLKHDGDCLFYIINKTKLKPEPNILIHKKHLEVVWGFEGYKTGQILTPFDVLYREAYSGEPFHAVQHLKSRFKIALDFVCVGNDYYQIGRTSDGTDKELVYRTKDLVIRLGGKDVLETMRYYLRFCVLPGNVDYQAVVGGNSLNRYHKPKWTPQKFNVDGDLSEIKHSLGMIKHLFGDKWLLGLEYIQVLWMVPTHMLPILVFASKERGTGKSTFGHWLRYIFGQNTATTDVKSMGGAFNGSIAEKLIICIEETSSESSELVNNLKKMSTDKTLSVNKKYQDQYDVDFFGKFIIMTNDPERFLRIDNEETRFWVNNVPSLNGKATTNIFQYLEDEIPHFLYFLESLKLRETKERMWFSAEEIATDQLRAVKEESEDALTKDIKEYLEDLYEKRQGLDALRFTIIDFHEHYFSRSNHHLSRVKRIFKEMGHTTTSGGVGNYFVPWDELEANRKYGRHLIIPNPMWNSQPQSVDSDDDIPF